MPGTEPPPGASPASTGTRPDAEAPALAVEGVGHRFGAARVLEDVSFAIYPGEFAVLLGLNGAGKTTMFSLVTRFYDNREGRIAIFGLDVRNDPSRALARIGVVFQQPAIDLDLSVIQNLRYHASLHGMDRRTARLRIESELARLGMLERAHEKVRQLSGGLRRRVEIARALVHEPRLLLLDEPTVGLDIESRQAIVSHVRALCDERGMAVLWATHLIDEVTPDDQVIVLHRGKVRAFGGCAEVVRDAGAANVGEAFARLTEGTRP